MTALNLVTGTPWAIMEPALKTITEIADRAEISTDTLREWKVEAVEAADGSRARAGGFTIRDSVGIINIQGPIFRHANMMTNFSGAQSLAMLAKDFNTALADTDVNSILLNIDSPGGQADGIAEFADMVFDARSVKPIEAFIDGSGASAAYWIAAAAEKITISKTGFAGSIGVVASFQDTSTRDAATGVTTLKFISSVSPNKQLDPTTDAGALSVQEMVDSLAAVFVNSVAGFRGVSAETVLSKFGQGGVMMGADAVSAGLVDAVGSFEGALASLASSHSVSLKGNLMTENTTATPVAVVAQVLTLDSVRADYPAIATAFAAEGATAERGRILGIEANALPGHDALITTLKADGTTTPEQAAVQVLNAERGKGPAAMDAIAAAVEDVPAVAADPVVSKPAADANAPVEERAKVAWDSEADLRAEFANDFECYLAGAKATDDGRAQILTK